ncbi:MAG: cytochrome c [Chloroflexota bacterium]
MINNTAVPPLPTLDAARVARGGQHYTQNCASCHGASLEGAQDWREPLPDGSFPPPPHDSSGHTWHHPDDLLLRIMAEGGDPAYNSRMPAFGASLSPEEMSSILEFIKSSWGPEEREFQWWITGTSGGE